jgi:hypothetical protein
MRAAFAILLLLGAADATLKLNVIKRDPSRIKEMMKNVNKPK